MAIGPLESFVFPGVLVQTINEAAGASTAGNIRFPAFIGTSAEEVRVSNFEMVRGSSAIADNIILDELVTGTSVATPSGFTPGWIGGVQGGVKSFRVENFPVVTGDGTGTVARLPSSVIVTVNGNNVAVNSVNGLTGEINLVVLPQATDDVRCNYYFKRRDTYLENMDISDQATGSNTVFKVPSFRIVKGDNSGKSATNSDINNTVKILYDPSPLTNPGDEVEKTVKVIDVKVLGLSVTVTVLDGSNGTFTLQTAPAGGTEVTVSYFTNNWQDTYDILPAPVVNRVVKIGLSQDTSDFSIGNDCVLSGSNKLHWGNSYQVTQQLYTVGSIPLANTMVTSITDTKVYGKVATPVSPHMTGGVPDTDSNGYVINDGTNLTFILPTAPVDGTGTGVSTEDPTKMTAYVGATWAAATLRAILAVRGNNVTIKGPAPIYTGTPNTSEKVFVTYFENNLTDDKWLFTNRVSGGSGVGKYTISSQTHSNALSVTNTGTGTVSAVYADGTPNLEVDSIRASVERVTCTFDGGGGFTVSSTTGPAFITAGRTGSDTALNHNKGKLGQTYLDQTTGFRVTFASSGFTPTPTPGAGSTVIYDIGDPTSSGVPSLYITCDSNIVRVIPGINFTMSTTLGSYVDDTVAIDTYNKSGNEPNNGDMYYVTFDKAKTDYTTRFLISMRDVLKYYGPLDINNKLTIAANLAFMNGAQAVAMKQIRKVTGGTDASVQDYIDGIDAFNEPMPNGLRPTLIQPLSSDPQVQSYLKTSNATQSSIRYRNERTSIVGFAVGTTSDEVIQRCKNLASEKITAVYPDGAIIGITDTYGNEVEYIVDGSIIAAAVAGRDASPATDIATPLTNATVVGFKRLYRRLDNVTAALVANSGCTVLEEQTPVIRILMYLTTDMSTSLTRDPRIVEVKHWIQQGMRVALNRYIGSKNLPKMQPQIRDTVGSYFKNLKKNEIITDYTGIMVKQNESDPSTVDVEAYYSPVFPLNWIVVTLNLRQGL